MKRKLKHNVLIANYNEGGLKLTDIPSYVKAQKLNWIKRFLVNENNVSYLQEFIPELSINHYLMCTINPKHIVHPILTFYRQVLTAWFELYKEPTTLKEVLSEVIWLNKNILVADNTIFYKKFYKKGIVYIRDIIDQSGTFLSVEAVNEKYEVKFDFVTYAGLIKAIPNKWKQIINLGKGKTNFTVELKNVYENPF